MALALLNLLKTFVYYRNAVPNAYSVLHIAYSHTR